MLPLVQRKSRECRIGGIHLTYQLPVILKHGPHCSYRGSSSTRVCAESVLLARQAGDRAFRSWAHRSPLAVPPAAAVGTRRAYQISR